MHLKYFIRNSDHGRIARKDDFDSSLLYWWIFSLRYRDSCQCFFVGAALVSVYIRILWGLLINFSIRRRHPTLFFKSASSINFAVLFSSALQPPQSSLYYQVLIQMSGWILTSSVYLNIICAKFERCCLIYSSVRVELSVKKCPTSFYLSHALFFWPVEKDFFWIHDCVEKVKSCRAILPQIKQNQENSVRMARDVFSWVIHNVICVMLDCF